MNISEDQLALLLRKAYYRGIDATIKNAKQSFTSLKHDETLKDDLEMFLVSKAITKWIKKPIKAKLVKLLRE